MTPDLDRTIAGLSEADDETCTSCYGTGYDGNREAWCHCQPAPGLPVVDQTVEGIGNPRGNCLQAALATVTGLPLSEVIDLTAPEIDQNMWHVALTDWGRTAGFDIASTKQWPEEEYCIGVGPTVRDNGLHAIVIRNREPYRDPHSSRAGLTRVRYFLAVRQRLQEMNDG